MTSIETDTTTSAETDTATSTTTTLTTVTYVASKGASAISLSNKRKRNFDLPAINISVGKAGSAATVATATTLTSAIKPVTTTGMPVTNTPQIDKQNAFNIFLFQADSVVSTICSCIETPLTITTTARVNSTKWVTATTTLNVTAISTT